MTNRKKKLTRLDRNIPLDKTKRFIEEFSWLLESYSTLDFDSFANTLRHLTGGSAATSAVGAYASANPNKQFLVGALPRVLMDETLFPSNEDIAQFADSVMSVRILRFQKKSKYELIGHIVCETDALDDRKLAKLVAALATLADVDDKTKRIIQKRKAEKFGWNAIIQELAK